MKRASILATAAAISVAGVVVGAGPAGAISPQTTSALKQACETSLNNRVVLTAPTQIKSGGTFAVPERVTTKCTIVLSPGTSLLLENVGLRFAGPLRIESTSPASTVEIVGTNLSGSAVTAAITGTASKLVVKESSVRANGGNLTVNMGAEATLEAAGSPFAPLDTFGAAGRVTVNGGTKFLVTLSGGRMRAPGGVAINLNGSESVYKASLWNLESQPGPVSLRSTGAKTLVELGRGSLYGEASVDLVLSGAESTLLTSDYTAFNTALSSGVNISVSAATSKGTISMNQPRFGGDGAISIGASVGSSEGKVSVVQGSFIGAPLGVSIASGALGSTSVADTQLASPGPLAILTGAGGSCQSSSNVITNAISTVICP